MRATFISLALIVLAMVSIQSGASLAKHLFPIMGALGVTALRVSFAALILLTIWRPWSREWPRRGLGVIAAYGFTLGIMNLLFYLALARIPLGIAVALEFTGPLAIALLRSRRVLDLTWALLAALGIGLLLPFGGLDASLDSLGVALALGAGICWGLYIVMGQRAGQLAHSGVITSLGMLSAAVVTLPFGLFDRGLALFRPEFLPWALAIAVFSSALPYSLEMVALKRLPAQSFSILMSLEPAIASLSGAVFLKEMLSPRQMLAIALVIGASLGTALSSSQKAQPEPP